MIVATAGHVDHGKTALVKALTGVDTDRLPEEKARGISIDLGFAYATTPGGASIGFVDVPGHERFVRNMVAGVCGIDTVMLVIAADDGIMPQTREHVAIVDLLGVRSGVVVISKVDCVAPARVSEVRAAAGELVAGTGLAGAPVIEVSALTGAGIATLRATLDATADAHTRVRRDGRGFRFAIDRVFSVPGAGTVATGTVFEGMAEVGERHVLSPAGREVRIRGIQVAGRPAPQALAGQRCALNLAGVERDEVARGQWVAAVDASTHRADVRLRVLPDAPALLRHCALVHVHSGTASVAARVLVPGGQGVAPGAVADVRLELASPLSLTCGARFIVRDAAATRTLGGGVVLDPFPPRRAPRAQRALELEALARADPALALPRLLAASPLGVDVTAFMHAFNLEPAWCDRLLRQSGAVLVHLPAVRALPAAAVEDLENAAVVTLARFHADSPQAPGMELRALRRAAAPAVGDDLFTAVLRAAAPRLGIEIVGSVARRRQHVATANRADDVLWQQVKPRLLEAGFRGRTLPALAADLGVREAQLADFLHRKAATGEVVRVTGRRFYPRELMAELAALATAMAEEAHDHRFIAAQFRDRSGVNRTVAIEILECLDRLGVTQRIGDARTVRGDFTAILGTARPTPGATPSRRAHQPGARPSA